jgi:hypothetical protein
LEIVLAQYDEDIAWSDAYSHVRTVYCKKSDAVQGCIPLDNVGREGHTYLYHIVKNYDKLAEWTVFSQAGKPTEGYKGHRLGGGHMMPGVTFADYLLQTNQTDRDGAFFVFTFRMHLPTLAHSLRDQYVAMPGGASSTGPASELTCPAKHSQDEWGSWWDIGWFREYLGARCGVPASQMGSLFQSFWEKQVQAPRPDFDIVYFAQGARFAASRARIHQRPKSYYEDLLQLVSSENDPCANYLNEWSWHYMIGTPQNAACKSVEADRPPASAPLRLLSASGLSGGISGGTTTDTTTTTAGGNTPPAGTTSPAGTTTAASVTTTASQTTPGAGSTSASGGTTPPGSVVEHSVESRIELTIDFDALDTAAKTQLQNGITEATVHSMYAAGPGRNTAMNNAATTLEKVVTSRRLAAAGAKTRAITKIKVATAALANAASAKVASVASAIHSATVAKVKAIPNIGTAIPGGVASLTISQPVAQVRQTIVTQTTTALSPPTNDVADVRCHLGRVFLLILAASFSH